MIPTTFDDRGCTVQDHVNRWRDAAEAALEARRERERKEGTS